MKTIAALFLTLLLCGCDALNPSPEAVITKSGGDAPLEQTGKALYERNCANCHGLDGISVTNDVTQMKGWAHTPTGTFGKLDTAMMQGPGGMPRFDTLNTEARMKIYEHMKNF
ncbi:MAG: cytochrome c [Chlorobi bacterium]|nr:cytochrome c [Chlorobiota bacterium]